MKIKQILILVLTSIHLLAPCQKANPDRPKLTIKKIMQDPKWIGVSPGRVNWSPDGSLLYFNWNPEGEENASLYKIKPGETTPVKVTPEERKEMPATRGDYNKARTQMIYEKNGDIFLLLLAAGEIVQITNTVGYERSPFFSQNEKKIIFTRENNLFAWEIQSGHTTQLTNFVTGQERPERKPYSDDQEEWLYHDQLRLFEVLREKKEERERSEKERELYAPETLREIYTGKERPSVIEISPDEKYIVYLFYKNVSDPKRTEIPNYVTESGYTETRSARAKVGTPYFSSTEMFIYDIHGDTTYQVLTDQIPGIGDPPDYIKDYPDKKWNPDKFRKVMLGAPVWSDDGENAVLTVSSLDNKDRWIMHLDVVTGTLKLLDRQRDEAWIGGPGTGRYGSSVGWMPDNKSIWFQSEESGYSHLYTVNILTGKKKALTRGSFEIYNPSLSLDKKHWYFVSNEIHPGERHFYRMPLEGGKREQITHLPGRCDVSISPDEKWFALIHSTSNHPEELYLLENTEGAKPIQITHSVTEEFSEYPWREPEVITFTASDGAEVYARLYRPDNPIDQGPAVIFVHGAGYLQNAHKWWSSYFREYMFHNFLADHGYTVLDIDYRGSAGYGRDWRTAIYRHMGGKDLSDQVDGAKFLVEEYQVDSRKIGIYGGSYGGFITLMAMFTQPDVFAAGAALRAVTDWAHYNHGYTANILNTPVEDSLAYVRSSPIYYAEGLKGALLICHGMIDDNVHFQDVVRLAQRLIELGKENWEFAVYPVERHSFTEPSSWTDEYRRIFNLFEEHLK